MSQTITLSGDQFDQIKNQLRSLVDNYCQINNDVVDIKRSRFRTDSEVVEKQLGSIANGFNELTKEVKSLKESRKKIHDEIAELHVTMAKLMRDIKALDKYELIIINKEPQCHTKMKKTPSTKRSIKSGRGAK